jgi:DNA replication protein DnaC
MELSLLLERMKMEHLSAQLDGVCEQAAKGDLDYKGFLAQALEAEWRGRYQRSVEGRLKLARFPWVKTLDQFDFEFQPSIDRKMIRELAGLSFVERTDNVVLLGPPGVGKTHLAIALGIKAVEAGYSVLFLTLETLMSRLVRARHENRLDRILQQLVYPRVLILDELGYLPLTREEASLFFRLLVRRYERASLIVTSNKSFADWGELFND